MKQRLGLRIQRSITTCSSIIRHGESARVCAGVSVTEETMLEEARGGAAMHLHAVGLEPAHFFLGGDAFVLIAASSFLPLL